MANPDWTRDELILALDLYFREPKAQGNESHPGCVELSKILNSLPIHEISSRESTFRNPNGIGMKLINFRKYDPTFKGKGLPAGSRLEEEVWNNFASSIPRLIEVSNAIKSSILDIKNTTETITDLLGQDEEASEGKLLTALHKKRERNTSLIRKKKNQVLVSTGKLSCDVCQFDFYQTFGEHGRGFAECHHDHPISKMSPGDKTKLSDLRIVCANCHRMLHRGNPWPTINELRLMIYPK